MRRLHTWALGVALLTHLAGCTGGGRPLGELCAEYFGMVDGRTFEYQGPSLSEIHAYTRRPGIEDRWIFDRKVTRGGFVEDDTTFSVEATAEGIFIIRYFDCITRCGEPSEPIKVLEFPVNAGDSSETEVELEIMENGAVTETRTEKHRFAVASPAEVTVPAGTFNGFNVVWTRTVDGVSSTAGLVFVENIGFVSVEPFDGGTYALKALPEGLEADAE